MSLTTELTLMLVSDEALRLKPYRCSKGKLTIGVGRNLDDNGISKTEAMYLLENDIMKVYKDLDQNFPEWKTFPKAAQLALANMCFNLGWGKLSLFKKMLAGLKQKRFDIAAKEARDSLWASQVGERANRIVKLFETCMEGEKDA